MGENVANTDLLCYAHAFWMKNMIFCTMILYFFCSAAILSYHVGDSDVLFLIFHRCTYNLRRRCRREQFTTRPMCMRYAVFSEWLITITNTSQTMLLLVSAPLRDLTKKNSHFQWKTEHQNAFGKFNGLTSC